MLRQVARSAKACGQLSHYTAQSFEGLPIAISTCLLQSRLFSSSALGTTPAPVEPSPSTSYLAVNDGADFSDVNLTPREVVEKLDKYIVGQSEAKRAVANALRNRWRRHKIKSPMKEEIVPKNILMIGPTGCGKTEIARRLAKLADAPFVKVEATKFTEVGFHGRDVDQIIRDLVDNSLLLTKQKLQKKLKEQIDEIVENKILEALCGPDSTSIPSFRGLLRDGQLEEREGSFELPASGPKMQPFDGMGGIAVHELISGVNKAISGGRTKTEKRNMKVSEARPLLEEAESERLINQDTVQKEAIQAVEQDGMVFIDEIDKIVVNHDARYGGADASSEGVQRDLLPIIEGSVVSTKYGNVNTDHILFICSGAFHSCKPSDMLAELQGRLPIRVELKGLTSHDFYRILTEPENNMLKQQQALMQTEGIQMEFTDAAIREISRVAEEVNTSVDNIGARRLHTVLERIVEEISFDAPEKAKESEQSGQQCKYTVDKKDVKERVGELLKRQDLSKYVL